MCLSFDSIIDACAIAIPDSLSGNRVVLFINFEETKLNILKDIKIKIKEKINKTLSSYHLPKEIYFFKNIPKTKSGKIMRRIMRDLLEKKGLDQSQDYSTLANKEEFLFSRNIFIKQIKRKI